MRYFFFLLCSATVLLSFAQESKSPSLVVFNRVDSLYYENQLDSAIVLLDNYISSELSSPNPEYALLAQSYIKMSECLRAAGKSHRGIDCTINAIKYAKLAKDSVDLANAYREQGYTYIYTGRYEEGLEAYNLALQIDRKREDWENIAIGLNAIGKIYELWRNFDQALDIFAESLKIAEEQNNLNQVTVRMASIASVYKSQEKFDLALEWLEKSLIIEKELKNVVRMGYRYDQIGEIHTLMGNYAMADKYLKMALTIFSDNNVLVSKSIVLNHLGLNSFKLGDFATATKYYKQSLAIAEEVSFLNMRLKNHQELSMLFETTGRFKNSLEHYKLFFSLKDSAYNERAQKQLMDFQAKYETEQKEKELALLNQQKLEQELELNQANQQKIVMIGISLILLVLLGSLFSRYNIKRRSQAKLSVLNAELNELNTTKDKLFSIIAHDLRNSTSAFSSIVETLNKNFDTISSDNIKYYLGQLVNSANSLKGLLKNLLEWAKTQQNRISINPETLNLADFINDSVVQLNSVANQKDIKIEVNIKENTTIYTDRNILNTILRNLISNAIKYSHNGSVVQVNSHINGSNVLVSIHDFGVGMSNNEINDIHNKKGYLKSKPGVDGEKGSGLGIMLCKDLLEKISGQLAVTSQSGVGSTFSISIPIG